MQVYVNRHPRSLALTEGDYVLIIRYAVANVRSGDHNDEKSPPKCIIEFVDRAAIDFSQYRLLSPRECHGCLGLIEVKNKDKDSKDVYLCVITKGAEVARPRPGETVNRIYSVEFYCVNRGDWDFVTLDPNGYAIEQNIALAGASDPLPKIHVGAEHPCANLRKLLSNGSFYYSTNFDLATTLQYRGVENQSNSLSLEMADRSFMWNSFMIEGLILFRSRLSESQRNALDKCNFLTSAIRGFAESKDVRIGRFNEIGTLTIISRQSWRRAGTRFNARGVDDEGNVANFVETETILNFKDLVFGFTQIRGSVPVFWEQDASLMSATINITRSAEATQPAFNKHFDQLVQKFGIVHVVNLLANKSGEIDLSERYKQHIIAAKHLKGSLRWTWFDFHAEVAARGYSQASRIIPLLDEGFYEISFYSDSVKSDSLRTEQMGIFRTNCLDCLDRTNMIQQLISKRALEMFFDLHHIAPGTDIWSRHNIMWADNGDQLSQIYAGTNALKTSYTRSGRMGLAGAIADVTKSVSRMYINNFVDKSRQSTMDSLLGRNPDQQQVVLYDPINDYVNMELNRRVSDFSSTAEIKIFAGTFNLNGVMAEDDLSDWLFPPDGGEQPPDIVLVGFQEIVELTPSQILNAEPYKREFWEKRVLNTLNQRDEYVLVRSDQLVGTALMMFVRKAEVNFVRKVEGAMIKTGLGGMAGNKGGVGVSFYFANTSFCFITAHLAAGTNNVEERHHNYKTISSGLVFSRGRRIMKHDCIIWLGDFNYRVNLPYDYAKNAIERGDLQTLLAEDQLNQQMYKGEAFPYYNEMEIKFPPTYKFDNDSNEYDTSEKMRTPSWTDRILSKGTNLHQTSYGCVQSITFSDHRPVYATFKAKVTIVDEELKEKLAKQLYDSRRAEVGDTNDLVSLVDLNETTLTHGLPPPSTDSRKWWLSGGQSSKIDFQVPPGKVINPNRNPNPFIEDKDFIDKPPLPPRPSTQDSITSIPAISPDTIKSSSTFSESTGSAPAITQPARATTFTAGSASTHHRTKSSTPPPVPKKPTSLRSGKAVKPSESKQTIPTLKAGSLPPPLPPRKINPSPTVVGESNNASLTTRQSKNVSLKKSALMNNGSNTSLMDDDGDAESVRGWTPPPQASVRSLTNSIHSNNSTANLTGGQSTPKSLLDDDGDAGAVPGLTLLQPSK